MSTIWVCYVLAISLYLHRWLYSTLLKMPAFDSGFSFPCSDWFVMLLIVSATVLRSWRVTHSSMAQTGITFETDQQPFRSTSNTWLIHQTLMTLKSLTKRRDVSGTQLVMVTCLLASTSSYVASKSSMSSLFHTHMYIAFNEASEDSQKDWVFQNYTFKRFEGLTQRGHLRL